MFGFTEGSDIGKAGDKELEVEGGGRLGKRNGAYSAVGGGVEGKFTITDYFRVSPGLHLAHFNISDVLGIQDRRSVAYEAVTLEMKFRLLDRAAGPFGLTLGVAPQFGFVDEKSGARAEVYGVDVLIAADKEIVPDKLFGAANLRYEPASSRVSGSGEWERGSGIAASGALATQIHPGIFVGGEIQYQRSFGGLGVNAFTGHAVFLGPTCYARLSEQVWFAAAWSFQVAGSAADETGQLDLTNFERQEFKVRVGCGF